MFLNINRSEILSHSIEDVITELTGLRLLQNQGDFLCLNEECNRSGLSLCWIKDLQRIDGGYFRCSSCRRKRCRRDLSIFEDLRLPLSCYYRCIFICYLKGVSIDEACLKCDMGRSTVKKIYSFCKTQIAMRVSEMREERPLCILEDYD